MDYGHEQADKMLKDLEKKIQKEYSKAAREVEVSMNKYLAQYKKNDDKMRALWKSGEITKKDYTDWRKKQMILSDKWKAQRDELTQRYMEADKVASGLINDHKMDVYALNYNYGTYEVEKGARLDTGFSLYNKDSVARLVKDNPKLLPPPGKATSEAIRRGELKRWNQKQIQSVMTQGILQGESIQKISKRLAVTVGEKNAYSHYRAARTMTTSAENAGRLNSYKRAEDMGIKMGKTWLAAHDNHTRASHREYDGMTIPLKEEFAHNLMFPGDPDADPAETYNCRCSLVADVLSVDGIDLSDIGRGAWEDEWDPGYNEWKNAHEKKPAKTKTVAKPKVWRLETRRYTPVKSITQAEQYAKDTFVEGGGFNLTGKTVSFKGVDVDIANRINHRLTSIYEQFDISKLSSLECFGKVNKKVFSKHSDAPFITTNFGNIGINNTILKNAKELEKYNESGRKSFQYVMDNIDKLTGEQRRIALAYQKAGKSLVGDSLEDMITHEVGHHISYMPRINSQLREIQTSTDWKKTAERLSGYANHSFGEYVAESFNAYCRGEHESLQPEMIKVFDNLRK